MYINIPANDIESIQMNSMCLNAVACITYSLSLSREITYRYNYEIEHRKKRTLRISLIQPWVTSSSRV